MLRERIRKEKDADTQESLKKMLTKMVRMMVTLLLSIWTQYWLILFIKQVSAEKMDEDKKRKQALIRERKKKEAELVKQGKKPFFLKKCKVLQLYSIQSNYFLS